MKFLEEIFSEEISVVDPGFYLRMKESKYHEEDKNEALEDMNVLFSDKNFKDKDYHSNYPTIYHLRKAIVSGVEFPFTLLR